MKIKNIKQEENDMKLLELFQNELRKNGEETPENIIHALQVIDILTMLTPISDTEIMEFGDYFMENYDDLTKEARTSMHEGLGPFCLHVYEFERSTKMDRDMWNTFGRNLSKKEQFELREFKKELQKIFEKNPRFAMEKELYNPIQLCIFLCQL